MLELRDYQLKALKDIRAEFAKGNKKVLLHLATGAGKTVIFCNVLKGVKEKNKNAIMVVRGRHLVDQGSDRLSREGVDHGVLMAGHWRQDFNNSVQVCSIDTLRARKLLPKADLIVIDEAHYAVSESYKNFLSHYPDAFILAVTATPYPKQGLDHIANTVVHPISVSDLIEQNYLVPPRYYAPFIPNMDGVRVSKSTGDYVTEDLEPKMGAITGDLVTHWNRFGEGRKSICFAVSVNHSLQIVEAFNKAGIPALHMEAKTPDRERKEILKKLEEGEISIVSNVGILCTGVDLPYVSCIIMARPTKSYNLYIQQAGRGTRTFAGKDNFLLLDHAGNILRHGFITSEREAVLDPDKKVDKPLTFKRCQVCFAVFSPFEKVCPECGAEIISEVGEKRGLEHLDGELVEISPNSLHLEIRAFIVEKKDTARRKGYKKGWVYFKLKEKYGEEIANQYMPKRVMPQWVLDRYKSTSI